MSDESETSTPTERRIDKNTIVSDKPCSTEVGKSRGVRPMELKL